MESQRGIIINMWHYGIFIKQGTHSQPFIFGHSSRESLPKGMDQYTSPPHTNTFVSDAIITEKILFYKTSYLNKEINRTEPSLSMRVPLHFVCNLRMAPIS